MNARYYTGAGGKFASQDPVFLAVGDGEIFDDIIEGDKISDINEWLDDLNLGYKVSENDYTVKKYSNEFKDYLIRVQELNSYGYVANNPLKYIDNHGEAAVLAAPALVIGGEALISAGTALLATGAAALAGIAVAKLPEVKWTPNQTLPRIYNDTPPDETNLFPNGPPKLPSWKKAAILIGSGAATIGYTVYEKYQEIKESANNYTETLEKANQGNNEYYWRSDSKKEYLKSYK